jgi:hypothetical protein
MIDDCLLAKEQVRENNFSETINAYISQKNIYNFQKDLV